MLNWAKRFGTFCFLDNHHYHFPPHRFECVLAAGVKEKVSASFGTAFGDLNNFLSGPPRWLFGHLGYDLKNETEALTSSHPDHIGFADLFFFEPLIIIRLSTDGLEIDADDPAAVFEEIMSVSLRSGIGHSLIQITGRMERDEYMDIIKKLKEHILRGDCYEINFCQEFYATNASIDPVQTYCELSALSPNPFSALYRVEDSWLICASPERFLNKHGYRILSQPMKGTAPRMADDKQADETAKKRLAESAKDRSENVMVVDIVRNDLSRVCTEGSVKADELFGVYSFPHVHQMISTVSGHVRPELGVTDIFRATFPMGSMTGAPKKRVMELIERYEKSRRGIFSGALGYITPEFDFDFNVVIRSIMYNNADKYLSFQVGSGITWYSDPEAEWEECLVKGEAIRQVISNRKSTGT